MADTPLPQYYRKAYQDFTEGLATRANPLMIKSTEWAQLDNAVINESDILQKAPGYILDGSPFPNSTDSFIRMLTNYKVGTSINTLVCAAQDNGNSSGTNVNYLVDLKQSYGTGTYSYFGHTVGTALFTHNSTTVTGSATLWTKHLKAGDAIGTGASPSVWYEILTINSDTTITLATIYTGTTTSSLPYMARIRLSKATIPNSAVFDNQLVVVNGSETPMVYDNTTLNKLQSASIQPANFILAHKNRIFMFNWAGDTSGMIWTAVNDITTIDPTSYVSVFPYDNGNIVSAISFANSILVFKDNGTIYQVTGDFSQSTAGQPSAITKIDAPDNIGVIAGRSCVIFEDNSGANGYQQLGSKVYFLSETGIYTINSWMQVNKVSWQIQPNVTNLLLKSTITTNKSFSFSSKATWDSGTITALSDVRIPNAVSSFCDKLGISTSAQLDNGVATHIDSNNDIHIAWFSSDSTTVNYSKWIASDNSYTTQVAVVPLTYISTITGSFILYANYSVGLCVAPNGNVGIITTSGDFNRGPQNNGSGRSWVVFSELSGGAWTNALLYTTPQSAATGNAWYGNLGGNGDYGRGISAYYTAGNEPRILSCINYSTVAASEYIESNGSFFSRTAGVWTTYQIESINNSGTNVVRYKDCDLKLDGSGNLYAVFAASQGANDYVEYAKSTNGGSTWTFPLISSSLSASWITPAGTNPTLGKGKVFIDLDENSNVIIVYNFTGGTGGDTGSICRYNVTPNTPTKTTVVSGTVALPAYAKGYYNSGGSGETYYCSVPVSGSYREQFIFNVPYNIGTASFTGGSTDIVGTGTKWTAWILPGDRIKLGSDSVIDYGTVLTVNSDTDITLTATYAGSTAAGAYHSSRTQTVTDTGVVQVVSNSFRSGKFSNNGNLFATCAFGVNANEINFRRITTQGKWVSPTESDITISQWSTYSVTGNINNGNSLIYQANLSSSSSFIEGNNNIIVPGTVVSTDATKVFIKATITFILQNFASSSVPSLIINYVGVGADSKMPTSYVFNNEMYLATTQQGQTGNTQILFLDRRGAWGNWTQTATCFARYNQQLYTGSSINGNIYKLRQGYNYAGSAYSLTAVSKEDLLGSLELQKEIYKVYLIYTTQLNGSFTFSYRLDNYTSTNGTTWTDQVVDQTTGGLIEIPIGKTCTSIQFKIAQNDLDVRIGIVGFTVLYKYINLR